MGALGGSHSVSQSVSQSLSLTPSTQLYLPGFPLVAVWLRPAGAGLLLSPPANNNKLKMTCLTFISLYLFATNYGVDYYCLTPYDLVASCVTVVATPSYPTTSRAAHPTFGLTSQPNTYSKVRLTLDLFDQASIHCPFATI